MVCENRDIWVFGYIVGPDCLQHMPPRNIYGFLCTSWVLITYIVCPPGIYIWVFGYILGPDYLHHMPPRNIYIWVFGCIVGADYIICPPGDTCSSQ